VSHNLSRRDFLRLAGLASGGVALPSLLRVVPATQPAAADRKNVLIVVFDAFSAYHLSLYGYGRETTPNITRLADRAIVYHNHFAAANWTVPGTAALLTGVLPWTHRAFNINQPVAKPLADKSVFHAFKDYHRIAYSHNPLVYTFFNQFRGQLDDYIPIQDLFLTTDGLVQTLFRRDDDVSTLSWMRAAKKALNGGYSYSLFLSELYRNRQASMTANFRQSFPRGLPSIREDNYFVLEQAIDSLSAELFRIPQPFLAYFHFMPPHEPYRTHRDFVNYFANDMFQPVEKSADPNFAMGERVTPGFLVRMRRQYDEYVLYLDREFARFFEGLEQAGLLKDTWVILTSDHGELFERGIWKHSTAAFYQPVLRVPLLIFEPGRTAHADIHTPTSNVDLLPTLLHLAGGEPAGWSEGTVLPPFAEGPAVADRNVYAVQATDNAPNAPLTKASTMLVKKQHKLTYYFGQFKLGQMPERIELYDIENDPEELKDLYPTEKKLGGELLDELKTRLAEVNRPFQ